MRIKHILFILFAVILLGTVMVSCTGGKTTDAEPNDTTTASTAGSTTPTEGEATTAGGTNTTEPTTQKPDESITSDRYSKNY